MKKYLIAGLLVLVPLVMTIWVISLIVSVMDQSVLLLPREWRPQQLFGFRIPGFGAILTFVVVFITGVVTTNFIGQHMVKIWDRFLNNIPIVRSVYGSVKQVSDTLFSDKSQAFREAVLLEYPRKGLWTIAFRTGCPGGNVASHFTDDDICIYVPTTPNPTSGFFLIVNKADVITLDMNVDDAFKYILSMGVAPPSVKQLKIT